MKNEKVYFRCKKCKGEGRYIVKCEDDFPTFVNCEICGGYGVVCVDDERYEVFKPKTEEEVKKDIETICKRWEWLMEYEAWKIRQLFKKYNVDDYEWEEYAVTVDYNGKQYVYLVEEDEYDFPFLSVHDFDDYDDYERELNDLKNNVPEDVQSFIYHFEVDIYDFVDNDMNNLAMSLGYYFEWEEYECKYYIKDMCKILMHCFETNSNSVEYDIINASDFVIDNINEYIDEKR